MVKVNDNYLKLPGSYLFSAIAKKVNAYTAANPDTKIIRLGIGDVTRPLTKSAGSHKGASRCRGGDGQYRDISWLRAGSGLWLFAGGHRGWRLRGPWM